MRHRAWLLLMLGAALAGGTAWGRAETPPPAGDDRLLDYRGKGEVIVNLEDEGPGKAPLSLTLGMEQIFRKPGTVLLRLNLFGDGLRQSFLTEGEVEQSYNPVQGLIIEKRYKNLDKAPTNPLVANQACMYDFGRKVRTAQNRRVAGTEKLLGYECDVMELDSKEIFQDLATGGILAGQRGEDLRNGRTKVWVMREYGLPLRVEIYGKAPKPAMSVVFTELQVNTGVGNGDLRLDAPPGTRKISVTADLADSDWEKKMEAELKQRVSEALGPKAGAEKPAGN